MSSQAGRQNFRYENRDDELGTDDPTLHGGRVGRTRFGKGTFRQCGSSPAVEEELRDEFAAAIEPPTAFKARASFSRSERGTR